MGEATALQMRRVATAAFRADERYRQARSLRKHQAVLSARSGTVWSGQVWSGHSACAARVWGRGTFGVAWQITIWSLDTRNGRRPLLGCKVPPGEPMPLGPGDPGRTPPCETQGSRLQTRKLPGRPSRDARCGSSPRTVAGLGWRWRSQVWWASTMAPEQRLRAGTPSTRPG